VFQSLSQTLPHLVEKCEGGLVRFAMECSRKIVAGIPISADLVEAVVREALQELQGITRYTIRLHPEDLTLLEAIQSGILPGQEQDEVRVAADATVERGGCVVETPFGIVDANRSTKFERIERAVQ